MAHNLNFNSRTGRYSFFSVKEKAWHGLGTMVEQYPSSREALQFAGLDYTVEKRAIFTYDNENQNADEKNGIKIPEILVPDYFATIRTDNETVLGVVGKDYEVVQNVDAFSFFDSIVDGEGIMYETAGALGKGERIFITAKAAFTAFLKNMPPASCPPMPPVTAMCAKPLPMASGRAVK